MTQKHVTFKLNELSAYLSNQDDHYGLGEARKVPAASAEFKAMVTHWLTKLEANPQFQDFQINGDPDLPQGQCNEIEVILATREQFNAVIQPPEGALGAFHTHHMAAANPYGDNDRIAEAARVLWVIDPLHLSNLIQDEYTGMPYDVECTLHAYLTTLFHEIEHAKLFLENSKFNTPRQIEDLYNHGELGNDLHDFISGYGIRELLPTEFVADLIDDFTGDNYGAEAAEAIMEEYVEGKALVRAEEIILVNETVEDVLVALNMTLTGLVHKSKKTCMVS